MIRLSAALRAQPLLVDLAIAVVLTLISLATVVAGAGDIGAAGGVSLVLLLLQTMPLVARRVWPVPIFLVTLGATAAHVVVSGGPPNSIRSTLGALIGLFTVSERYGRSHSIWAVALALAVMGPIIISRTGFPAGLGGLVQTTVAIGVAWILGTWSRERRAYVDLAEARAVAAERSRDEEARKAVAAERERIAREMHDVVTHHVSVMVIQAGAAEAALASRPDETLQAIAAIGSTGRQALADMRTMLGVLGPEHGDGTDDAVGSIEPMPGLDQLGQLIESVRAAGLRVELTVTGDRPPLHPGVELSAYRIIQEALTNTLKHARDARCQVTVRFSPTAVDLTIDDVGARGSTDIAGRGQGRGLIGMRERVAVFRGDFQAGETARGFRVHARLPHTPAETG